jgi:hypothetical protein
MCCFACEEKRKKFFVFQLTVCVRWCVCMCYRVENVDETGMIY